MLEVLKFTFESFGHFIGVCFLIAWICACVSLCVALIVEQYKPNKH